MFQSSARILFKYSGRFIAATFVTSYTAATYYRPISDKSHIMDKEQIILGPNRQQEFLCSNEKTFVSSRDETPLLLQIAQSITIGLTTVAIRIFMNSYGEYDIVDDEHYHHFLSLALGGSCGGNATSIAGGGEKQKRKENQGLITISNHRSMFDDPGVVSCLLPLWVGIQPKYNRWGICSQEYCFNDKLPSLIKGYIGAGQVLPIRRGGGIDQALFRDFASVLANGEWCHIFPEGGIWQTNELGGRGRGHDNKPICTIGSNESKLKWGIGKLIAHASTRPRVILFAHCGMENLIPKDHVTGAAGFKKKVFGGKPLRVHVRFGEGTWFKSQMFIHLCV